MFGDLLTILAAGRAQSIPDLAAILGTDARSLRLVLEQCQRLGYLEPVDGACASSACAGCPVACPANPDAAMARDRGPIPRPSWWRITERGERAVRASTPLRRA